MENARNNRYCSSLELTADVIFLDGCDELVTSVVDTDCAMQSFSRCGPREPFDILALPSVEVGNERWETSNAVL
jgi:hypothetical protein